MRPPFFAGKKPWVSHAVPWWRHPPRPKTAPSESRPVTRPLGSGAAEGVMVKGRCAVIGVWSLMNVIHENAYCVCIYIYTYMCVCIYIYIYIYIYINMCVCVRDYMYIMLLSMYIIYIYVCVCTLFFTAQKKNNMHVFLQTRLYWYGVFLFKNKQRWTCLRHWLLQRICMI